ncbi:MAG: ABC transporter substrate-binding protein, partial [Kurthia sp.]
LKEPYAGLLAILASNEGSNLNPTILKDSPDQLKTKPNGTGPFAFEKWDTGQEIDLVRNEDYWGDKPAFKQLIYKVVPEDATRVAMIENNEAQIAEQVPVTELDRVSNSDKMSLFRADGLAVEYLGFNVQNETLSNVKVRQAISHAIDREAIISGVYNGVGTLANSAMSPEVIGYSKNTKPFSYDIDQAKALLKEANLPKDQKITLTTSDRKERINMAEVIQSQLKGIGLTVEIKVLEYGAYIEEINKKQHQLFIGGWGNATGDGDYNQYNLFHTNSQGAPGNHFYYSNKKVDKLIEAARAESDIEKRKSYYEEAMKIELEEDTAYVPIRNYENLAIYSKNVEGFWLDATNQTKVKDIVIK